MRSREELANHLLHMDLTDPQFHAHARRHAEVMGEEIEALLTAAVAAAELVSAVEETAELVTARGGRGIAVPCDHTDPQQVKALIERIESEQDGRLDGLVNDVWAATR